MNVGLVTAREREEKKTVALPPLEPLDPASALALTDLTARLLGA
jgi:hypothetical protein